LHRVGIITGLGRLKRSAFQRQEAGARLKVVCVARRSRPCRGGSPSISRLPGGCGGLVSFGVAGGLAPGAPAGALLLADAS
jgi:hypothetical protein